MDVQAVEHSNLLARTSLLPSFAASVLLSTAIPGCANQTMSESTLSTSFAPSMPEDIASTLLSLKETEDQLDRIEKARTKNILLISAALIVKTEWREPYSRLLQDLVQMRERVEEYQRRLISTCGDEQRLVAVNAEVWNQRALYVARSLSVLVNFVEQNHFVPIDWKAPDGFEYVSEFLTVPDHTPASSIVGRTPETRSLTDSDLWKATP